MNGTTPNIFEYTSTADFVSDAAQAVEDFILWKLSEEKTVSIALSGGNSPKVIYEQLAKNKKIEWANVELFMVDERYVPTDSEASNFKMIEQTLLSKIPPVKSFLDFNTHLELEQAAEVYDQALEKRGRHLFDLVILGMGIDGHTASLFPHTEALKEKTKLATTCQSPDGMERLTLSVPAIMNAEKIIFLIRGKEKKEMVEKLTSEIGVEENQIPAKLIMKHPNVEIYFENR